MSHKTKLNLLCCIFILAASATITSCSSGCCGVGDSTPPAPIENLSFNPSSQQLSWTASGDNENSGTATIYDLRFLTDTQVASLLGLPSLAGVPPSTIQKTVQDNFSNASHVENLPQPTVAGTTQSFLLPRIDTTGTENFFFALNVRDEVGNNAGPSNVVPAQTPLVPVEFQNSTSGSCFGQSIGSGDFNNLFNNNLNPFSVSATPAITPINRIQGIAIGDPCLGRVYIFFGGNDLSGVLDVSTADVTIIGNASDHFGASVAGLGNIGGDNSDDLAIGAPGFNNGTGAVFIIFGNGTWKHNSPVTIDLTSGAKPNISITGESAGDQFGTAIVRLEGSNSTVLIGAPNAASGKGRAYNIGLQNINPNTSASQAKAIFTGPSAGDMFGLTLANTGDFNGDTFFDWAIGAPGIGKVYIFFGSQNVVSQDLSTDTSNVVILGGNTADGFGSSISGIDFSITPAQDTLRGDVNGDEIPDFIVGAPGSNNNTGSVFLYSGADIASAKKSGIPPNFIAQFTGINPGDKFGASISILGDINPTATTHQQTEFIILVFLNTNADFAVGAPGTSGGTGTVYLFFGRNNFTSTVAATGADLTLAGNSPGEAFGTIVMGTGDFTKDFINDLAAAGSSFVREEF
jgi:FG-GAP repeat protein